MPFLPLKQFLFFFFTTTGLSRTYTMEQVCLFVKCILRGIAPVHPSFLFKYVCLIFCFKLKKHVFMSSMAFLDVAEASKMT